MFSRDLFGPPIWFFVMFGLVASLVLGTFVYIIGKGIATAARNRSQPILSRAARVIGKRQEVWGKESTRTTYYLTFELTGGSREEFEVEGREFGLLAEGDVGMLHSQGSWFKGFDRTSRTRV